MFIDRFPAVFRLSVDLHRLLIVSLVFLSIAAEEKRSTMTSQLDMFPPPRAKNDDVVVAPLPDGKAAQ